MRHIVVGTAGHIDHGKSALVRALTGTDPDRLKEEKARGITIDLGFAHADLDGITVAFVDVPGHERFVRNMLAGASGIAAVLLVVAADESVMPQTREHFEICRLLGIPAGVVALTKSDLVDGETIELVKLEVRDLVAGSTLARAPVVPVSARTGAGLDALRAALRDLARRVPPRRADGVLRMPVDRAFSIRGFGTVVTGTVIAGSIDLEQELVLLPDERHVKVRGLQAHGAHVATAGAGQRLAVNLAGVDVADVGRGAVLVAAGVYHPTRRLDAAIELLGNARAVRHGTRVRVHHGTTELLGRVAVSSVLAAAAEFAAPLDAAPGSEIPPGARAHVRLRLERPAVLTRGDRFVLRAYSPPTTIGGGVVLDPHPARGGIRTAAARARFALLDAAGHAHDEPAALAAIVEHALQERGAAGLDVGALVSRFGLAPPAARTVEARLAADGRAVRLEHVLVSASVLNGLQAQLTGALADHHRADPVSAGLPREEARARLFARAHPAVFEWVVRQLAERNAVVGRDRLALASHRLDLSAEDARAVASVERAFRESGLKPPDLGVLAAATGLEQRAVDQAMRLLQRRKALVRLDTLWFHVDALGRLKAEIASMKGEGAPAQLDVAAFKQLYGVSRKYAIPLLEYLDRERVTRRVGETRVVL